MKKIVLILAAALVVASWAGAAEAASRGRMIRAAVPRVVDSATKCFVKVGEATSGFFWRNKVAIAAGTALVTIAGHPEPFIDGAVAVVAGPPIVVAGVNSAGKPVVVSRNARPAGSAGSWNGSLVLGGLIGLLGIIVLYEADGRARTAAKVITVVALFAAVIFFCGIAGAAEVGCIPETAALSETVELPAAVTPVAGLFNWRIVLDVVIILLTMTLGS